jgi:hypothetical protein
MWQLDRKGSNVPSMTSEIVLLRDKEWSVIEGAVCRVKAFTPMATVEDGRVTAIGESLPYASIEIECGALPEDATGYIAHKLDFLHLWAAFNERGVGEDEEVLVFWMKKNLKRSARLVSKFMPGLWVMVCPKDAYELMTDDDFKPELTGLARWEAMSTVAEWKPDVMDL